MRRRKGEREEVKERPGGEERGKKSDHGEGAREREGGGRGERGGGRREERETEGTMREEETREEGCPITGQLCSREQSGVGAQLLCQWTYQAQLLYQSRSSITVIVEGLLLSITRIARKNAMVNISA